jgi:Zn-dependent peptidase ImmA (M78 family)
MNYSRVEIDELGEEIVRQFIDGFTPNAECVNIDLFVTDYLKLPLVYESFAEDETDRLGFTSNGKRKLRVMREGRQVELVFPTHTIVVDAYLKRRNEDGKRRFTIAHEAAHNIFDRDNGGRCEAHFYCGFDSEKEYSVEALRERMNMCEWQANAMAAAILMPRFLVEQALQKYAGRSSLPIYGNTILSQRSKNVIDKMASVLGVSYSSLVIRLRELNLLEHRDKSEYVTRILNLKGSLT